jgi:predicted dinucleotide-binding enzyme
VPTTEPLREAQGDHESGLAAVPGPGACGAVPGHNPSVLIAAEDPDAKQAVSRPARGGGMRAVDAGPLARAHELEAVRYLHMALQEPLGTGFASAVKILA